MSRVAQHVREVVEEAGGIVAHHTSRKTEFDHVDYGDQAWRRAGYVGTYQRYQEKPVQVRIRVWAQWPRRLLVGSIYVGFAVALLFFALSILEAAIPPNVWIFTAIPILAAIAASLLMYTSSMADSEGAEEEIEALLVERLAEDEEIAGQIYDVEDWEAYRETVIAEAKDEARERTPYGGSRLRRAAAQAKGSLGLADEDGGSQEPDEAASDPEAEPPEAEPQQAGPPEGEPADDEEPGFLGGVKAKLGGDDEPAPDEGPDEADDEEGPGWLARTKATLGLGGEDPAEGDDGSDAPDADEAETDPEPATDEETEDPARPAGG